MNWDTDDQRRSVERVREKVYQKQLAHRLGKNVAYTPNLRPDRKIGVSAQDDATSNPFALASDQKSPNLTNEDREFMKEFYGQPKPIKMLE